MNFPKILDSNGHEICEMTYNCESNVHYYKFSFNGMVLYMYHVLKFGDSYNYCIYNDQNQLVGIIKRKWKIRYNPQTYFYSINDQYMPILVMLYVARELNKINTDDSFEQRRPNEETKQKYSEEFIKSVEASAGPQNIPENMPLFIEMMKKSKRHNKKQVIRIILFIAILLGLIFFFGYAMFSK